VESFSLERVSKSGAKFDFEKAKWFNQQYIKLRSKESLLEELREEISAAGIDRNEADLLTFIGLFQDRVTFIKDFLKEGYYVFARPTSYDEAQFQKRWQKETVPTALNTILQGLQALTVWDAASTETVIKGAMHDFNLKPGELMPAFRIMISGEAGGPPLFELAELLGQDEVIQRMEAAIAHFSK